MKDLNFDLEKFYKAFANEFLDYLHLHDDNDEEVVNEEKKETECKDDTPHSYAHKWEKEWDNGKLVRDAEKIWKDGKVVFDRCKNALTDEKSCKKDEKQCEGIDTKKCENKTEEKCCDKTECKSEEKCDTANDCKSDYDMLCDKYEHALERCDTLEKEMNELRDKFETVFADNERITNFNDSLQTDIEKLIKEVDLCTYTFNSITDIINEFNNRSKNV